MAEMIIKTTAYEKHDGAPHVFEEMRTMIDGAAPYMLFLDGAFYSTAESRDEIYSEIEDAIKWFGWSKTSRIFA